MIEAAKSLLAAGSNYLSRQVFAIVHAFADDTSRQAATLILLLILNFVLLEQRFAWIPCEMWLHWAFFSAEITLEFVDGTHMKTMF